MSTIGKLLGRSPFHLLQRHMEQVAKCMVNMDELLDSFAAGEWEQVETLATETSRLEHEADQIKDDIRNQLLRRFFMPINRSHVLEILSIQDGLADAAENVSVLLTIKKIVIPDELLVDFRRFRELNGKAFQLVQQIVSELDELLETGFGGSEAEKIRNRVRDVAYAEHQVDVLQRKLLKVLFSDEVALSAADLTMWVQLVKELSSISNMAENLADRMQMTLDLK